MSVCTTSGVQSNLKADKACICLCGLDLKAREKGKCPNHLKNWELWMLRRKCVHQKLGKKLRREPGNLLMNSGDMCRGVNEDKLVLEYRKIENHFDKYRGNPEFWKLPCSLKDRRSPYGDSEYFAVKTKQEKNIIPEIEFVGVPDAILEEKHILPRTRFMKSLWSKSTYRQEVVQRELAKLTEIEPHKPDLSHLIVLGFAKFSTQSHQNEEPALKVSETDLRKNAISETAFNDSSEATETSSTDELPKLSLKIDHKEINTYTDFAFRENKICKIFEYFTDQIMPTQQAILFENTGQASVRLSWNQYNKLKIFREYTESKIIFHPFKFDKGEILLLPGMKKKLVVCFQVEQPGNYYEHWEITSFPNVWNSDHRFIIQFKGFACIRNLDQRLLEVEEKLQHKVRQTSIKDILNELIGRGVYCEPSPICSFNFTEKELFESKNLVKNEPKYVYNAKIINELKSFYEETKTDQDSQKWDFSISTLIKIARQRDLYAYFENQMEMHKIAKTKRAALQEKNLSSKGKAESKKEKETPKKQAQKVNKDVLPEPQPKQQMMDHYKKLNDILKKLQRPSIHSNKERQKYCFSYIVLRTFFWKMFNQLESLSKKDSTEFSAKLENDSKSKHCIELNVNPYWQLPTRLTYEIFDEKNVLRMKRVSHISGAAKAKPKSTLLKGVVPSDVKKIFKIYFNKEETSQKSVKHKTDTSESTKSTKSKTQKSKNKEQDANLYLTVNEEFDAFAEENISAIADVKSQTVASSTLTTSQTSFLVSENIDEEKYLIVYVTLCDAIDVLVDTVELLKEDGIPSDTLFELQKCHILSNKASTEILEKTSIRTNVTDTTSQTSSNNLQQEYFAFLQDIHWNNNLNVKNYFVKEAKKSSLSIYSDEPKSKQISKKPKSASIQSNVFLLDDYIPQSEPYCLKERGIQTESYTVENGSEGNVSYDDICEESSSTNESKNIFYFLGNMLKNESGTTLKTEASQSTMD